MHLLQRGANPNLPIHIPEEEAHLHPSLGEVSTALVEACRNRDLGTIDALLKSGARDDDGHAFLLVAANGDELLMSKLLCLKSHTDQDHKINRKYLDALPHLMHLGSVTYSSLFPTTPVVIDWHAQKGLTYIKRQWLVEAALRINPKLKLNPRNSSISLLAITRLDLSNNGLTSLPEVIFQLPSLKSLNVAQNRIERLPEGVCPFGLSDPKKPLRPRMSYHLPVLEELLLPYNQLETLPVAVFLLPNLTFLDVSNNKLESLPYEMWTAPCLVELNASLNLLSELPCAPTKNPPRHSKSMENLVRESPNLFSDSQENLLEIGSECSEEENLDLAQAEKRKLVIEHTLK